MGLLDRIQAKIELFRLEQRYTRRRHRRSTFVSNAIYVDGEYIYQSPNTTGSSSATYNSAAAGTSNGNGSPAVVMAAPSYAQSRSQEQGGADEATKAQKRLNRWSSMPGFGSGSVGKKGGMGMPGVGEVGEAGEWRRKRVSFHDER